MSNELWDQHEAFLLRNDIKSLDDEKAFRWAHNDLQWAISDLRAYHRKNPCDRLAIVIEERKGDLARLEEVWFLASGKHL